ncbi:MAG: ribosomal L7Ae/L30e/S12e/Gadd45 family protein [archaeon]
MSVDDIKKLIGTDKAVFGTKRTLDLLKKGKIIKVYLSVNCPADVRKDVQRYLVVCPADVVELDMPNDELGTICKKPFAISVLGQLK